MMPGGTIFRSVQNNNTLVGGGVTGRMQKVDYNGTLLWNYVYSSSSYVLHHDHCILPNGNVLVICYEVKTPADVTAAGGNTAITVWSEKIMEWEPVGTNSVNVVWEWHLWDHLVQNTDPTKPNYYSQIVDHPELLNINYAFKKDWLHMNGIDYNPTLDQIALSSHNLNEWYIIDHSTTTAEAASHSGGLAGKGGDFLYRWGNNAAYQGGGTNVLNVTHDAHWVRENCPNAGYLAGVNNKGLTSPTNKTTADQIGTPRSGLNYTIVPANPFTPASYDARMVSSGYTSNMGSVEEYPNGNQLFCLAVPGLVYEVNSGGTTLWSKNTGGVTPQAHRYPQCYVDFTAPVQPSIMVTLTNSVLTTGPANSYQWYVNGNAIPSATNQAYTPTQSGAYVVAITDANNCVKSYSSLFTFTFSGPVDPVGIKEESFGNSIQVFPNPSTGIYNISMVSGLSENCIVQVVDLSGKILLNQNSTSSIDLSHLSDGFYNLIIQNKRGERCVKKISLIK